MKTGSVSLKDIVSSGRMDAEFHLTMKEIEKNGSLQKARESFSRDEAISLLGLMPRSYKEKASKAFVSGSSVHSMAIESAIEKYPLEILAVAFSETDVEAWMEHHAEESRKKAEVIKSAKSKLSR